MIRLNHLDSRLTKAIVFLVETTLIGYIMEFVTENNQSTSKAEYKLINSSKVESTFSVVN